MAMATTMATAMPISANDGHANHDDDKEKQDNGDIDANIDDDDDGDRDDDDYSRASPKYWLLQDIALF